MIIGSFKRRDKNKQLEQLIWLVNKRLTERENKTRIYSDLHVLQAQLLCLLDTGSSFTRRQRFPFLSWKINQNQFLGFSHRRIGGKKSSHENYSFRAVGSFSSLDRKLLMITGRGMRAWELWLYAVKCYVMHANKNKYYLSEHGLTNNKIKLCHKTRNFKPFDESERFCCKLKLND